MVSDYGQAIRRGTQAAARLHAKLGTRERVAEERGSIDVFEAMAALGLPVLLRPLSGLLGAYLPSPTQGVLLTTRRGLSVQRFTAAHELGHFCMGHDPSMDDDNIIRRSPFSTSGKLDFQEVEANAFAAAFLMPRWLITLHKKQQDWTREDLADPQVVYQLSLRVATSFEATIWSLRRYNFIDQGTARNLSKVTLRSLKKVLLQDYEPDDFRRDVWVLTEKDAGSVITGSRNDLFILRLNEHSGGGYMWNIEELENSGFIVLRDGREAPDMETVGSHTVRCVMAFLREARTGRLALNERRPWQPARPLREVVIDYDLSGPEEEGMPRAERRHRLEAA